MDLDLNDPQRTVRLDDIRAYKNPHFRDDANAVAFQRDLEHIMAATYEERLPHLAMANGEVLPIRSTVPRGMRTWRYPVISAVGVAQFFSLDSWASMPMVDLDMDYETGEVHTFGLGYSYSISDVETARATGMDLTPHKATAAKRGDDKLLNDIGISGDAKRNLLGLTNLPNGTVVDAPAGAGGKTRWTATSGKKTFQEMVDDLNLAVDTMMDLTDDIERPNIIYLPNAEYRVAQNTHAGTDANSPNVIQRFLADNPEVRAIKVLRELKTAGTGGRPCILAFREDPNHLWLEVPVPFEQMGPKETDNWDYKVATRVDAAGVIAHYPMSVIRIDFGAT